MRRRRREAQELRHLHVQQSKVIFNNETEEEESCGICLRNDNALINPCECSTLYHERCLLLYIRGVIRRGLREREEVDLSSIKCRRCEGQFHVYYTFRSDYNCQVFLRRMEQNCCNKHLAAIAILIIIIIVTVVVFINQFTNGFSDNNSKLMYGIIALLVIEGLLLLVVVSHFFQTYLLRKQIVLERVLEMIELRSMASSSSD